MEINEGYLIDPEYMDYILQSLADNARSYIDPDWDDDEECPYCGR